MRKLILLLFLSLPMFGSAFGSGTQWDVQTGGNDANGGAFDPGVASPGTDQSEGAATAFTDLIVATTTATSITLAFGTASPGNFLHIASGAGCNTGWFEILSQAAGTITANASMGTGTCTGRAYGPLLTIAQAASLVVAGNTVNIKAGTYTLTSTLTLSNQSIGYIGYQSTHGDGGTKPLITTATNSTDLVNLPAGSTSLTNISFANTAGTPANGLVKTNVNGSASVVNCKLTGFTSAINGDNQGAHYFFLSLYVANSEISTSTIGVNNQLFSAGGGAVISNSYFHGCTTAAIQAGSSAFQFVVVAGSVFDSNGYAVQTNNVEVINSVISNSTHDGINGVTGLSSVNSVYWHNGGYGVSFNAGGSTLSWANNGYGSNTPSVANISLLAFQVAHDVSLSVSPFVSSSNFALNSTGGGGAALKAAGFPGVSPAGTGYLDIGALQSQAAAGASIAAGSYVQ
jgi:hypothetical protein